MAKSSEIWVKIFRRFVTRNGITYDAYDYGLKAWCFWIRKHK